MRDRRADYEKAGARVLGASPDTVEDVKKFADKFDLDFTLLADADHAVAEKYGTWVEKTMYGKKYMGVQRATFIIDAEGKIAKVFPKVKPAEHDELVLEALAELATAACSTGSCAGLTCRGRARRRCPSGRRPRPARASAPAIGALGALVIRARALQRHAAGVVADRADLVDLRRAESRLGREGGQLGALVLDRARPRPGLLDQGGTGTSTASWARFHWQASCIGVSPAASAIGRSRSSLARPSATHPCGRWVRWSPSGISVSAVTSSQNSPP